MTEADFPESAKHSSDRPLPDSALLSELLQMLNVESAKSPSTPADAAWVAPVSAESGDQHGTNGSESAAAIDRETAFIPQTAQAILAESMLAPQDSVGELQKLLLGFDQAQLNQLRERLENPERRAVDVGQVLRQAILLQSMQPEQRVLFVAAMTPTVEQAIQESVQKNETVIADAISPIVGPATRKAITTALESMIQRLDQMLEQSLSPRALQWKLESLRTGKSFAEVVLLRTLVFRVEQVFLIHRTTGLLLQHVVTPTIAVQDPALVSAMLRAIEDFVQDSFTVQTGDQLETLRFGDLTVWIEQGSQAVLAGVLRGQAPLELRLVFRQAIEQIHREFGLALTQFQGDSTPFAAALPYLEACFKTEYKTLKRKSRPYFWLLFTCVAIGCGWLGYHNWQVRRQWTDYVQRLSAEPGIIVNKAENRWGKFFVSGLRDPLAVDPAALLPMTAVNSETVVSQWQPYLSLHPQFVQTRAQQILQPPATVSLTVDENGVLRASGLANQRWLEDSRRLAPVIPGVTQFQAEVTIAELQALGVSRSRIEAQRLWFKEGSTQLLNNPQALNGTAQEMQQLIQLTVALRRQVQIQIIGRANQRGSAAQNLILSQNRANAVLQMLVAQGVPPDRLTAIGMGTRQPLSDPQIPVEQLNRSVTFKVLFTTGSRARTDIP
jgi:OOP family OmpA-OmpF porin